MATCPSCGVRGRLDPDAFEVSRVLVASPIGTFSLAGHQMKVTAHEVNRLTCRHCGWFVDGRLVGDGFDADLSTQVFPAHVPPSALVEEEDT